MVSIPLELEKQSSQLRHGSCSVGPYPGFTDTRVCTCVHMLREPHTEQAGRSGLSYDKEEVLPLYCDSAITNCDLEPDVDFGPESDLIPYPEPARSQLRPWNQEDVYLCPHAGM